MIIIMITRLEDFILQSCDNGRNKGRLGVGKEWDGRDQGATVEVDHVLMIMNVRIMIMMTMRMIMRTLMMIMRTMRLMITVPNSC